MSDSDTIGHGMSPMDAVLDELHGRKQDSKRAARVYEYVDSAYGQTDDVTTTDLLWVLRNCPELALELRANTCRDVICALGDDHGEYRYPMWSESEVAKKTGGRVHRRSIERRNDIKQTLQGRRPRVVLRAQTELADLQAPSEWDRQHAPDGVFHGP